MNEKSLEDMTDEEISAMEAPEIKDDAQETSTGSEDSDAKEETSVEPEEVKEESKEESSSETENESEEKEEDAKEEDSSQEQPTVDYKAFYETVMSPLKANGKTVQLRSPEEVIRLIQMGANYTQKMQHLAPYRKKIQMLQKAQLLEDDKLNYLIDLAQGNPEAVKKLLRDSKLDPMDLDVQNEPKYVPGNHTISDAESRLQTTLDDLTSTPEGIQTIQIAREWDQASLQEIGTDPSILSTLHEQRMNGVYDFITKEMDHQRMLGNIPEGTPFLKAYKMVGDYCLKQLQQRQQIQQQQLASIPQGTLHKPQSNTVQVKSAAPSGRSKKAAQTFVDPFTLSDEEFEKQFANYA